LLTPVALEDSLEEDSVILDSEKKGIWVDDSITPLRLCFAKARTANVDDGRRIMHAGIRCAASGFARDPRRGQQILRTSSKFNLWGDGQTALLKTYADFVPRG
jgi:hypothetical protein